MTENVNDQFSSLAVMSIKAVIYVLMINLLMQERIEDASKYCENSNNFLDKEMNQFLNTKLHVQSFCHSPFSNLSQYQH